MQGPVELPERERIKRFWQLATLALLNTLAVLWPVTHSGFIFDDRMSSTLLGAMREHHLNLFTYMAAAIRATLTEQGRFDPVSAPFCALPMYFLGRFGYKVGALVMLGIDLAAFSALLWRITGSRGLALLFLAFAPFFFQLQPGPDPIMGFSWLMQDVLLLTILSLLFYWNYLERGGRWSWALAYGLSVAGLLSYEITYTFFLLPMALVAIHQQKAGGRLSFRSILAKGAPFFAATLLAAALVLLLRHQAAVPVAGKEAAYVPHLAPGQILLALVRHLSATLPLSFLWLSGLRHDYAVLSPGTVGRMLLRNLDFTDAWLFGSEALIIYSAIREMVEKTARFRARWIALLGSLLLVLPITLVILSPKYQSTIWIGWGYSYLPVLLSEFGALALAALLATFLVATYARLRVPLAIGLAALAALATITSHSMIRQMTFISRLKSLERESLEEALSAGILANLPPESYLILETPDPMNLNTSLFRKYVDVRLRKITGPGNFWGGPIPGNESTPLFSPANLIDLPLPAEALRPAAPDRRAYSLTPEHRVFLMKATSEPDASYVVFSRVREISLSNAEIFTAASDSALLFVLDGAPQDKQFYYYTQNGGARRAATLDPRTAEPISQTGSGRLYRLGMAAPGERIDPESLKFR